MTTKKALTGTTQAYKAAFIEALEKEGRLARAVAAGTSAAWAALRAAEPAASLETLADLVPLDHDELVESSKEGQLDDDQLEEYARDRLLDDASGLLADVGATHQETVADGSGGGVGTSWRASVESFRIKGTEYQYATGDVIEAGYEPFDVHESLDSLIDYLQSEDEQEDDEDDGAP